MTIRTTRQLVAALGLGVPQDPIDVTVIFPAYNEVEGVPASYEQIGPVIAAAGLDYELLFVDDGSCDGTWEAIQELAEKDTRVRGLRHRRNAGKASALANGITYARGQIIAICDADMQYDPADVLRVIEQVGFGYDAVTARKVQRKDRIMKRFPSYFFNLFVRRATGVKLHDMNAGLKAFSYEAANELVRYGYGELHRFFMVILAMKGYSIHEIEVESRPRTGGHTKYGAERYLRGAMDFLTVFFLSGYLERPLHLFGGAGITFIGGGAFVLTFTVFARLLNLPWQPGGTTFSVAALMMLTGVQLFGIGLIAEMVGNLENSARSTGKVSEVIGVERRSNRAAATGVRVDRRQSAEDLLALGHDLDAGVLSHNVQDDDEVASGKKD